MELTLYNTRTRRLEPFAPASPDRVTMYLCGPTVYNYVHIGNARGPVVFDVLASLLRRRYPKLVYARNITDVDDKINKAAQDLGVPITTITDKYTAVYRDDMAKLGVARQDVEPHATEHIPQMITMIEKLIADGHAYAAEGHVLFSIASYADYGKLSGRPMDEMIAGARIDVAPYKRDPGDFVLWKPSPAGLPGWDSPWGVGRPGWHIECSAMAAAHLGETIDIHAGGNDLLFPHHENEVAQSTCAHGGKVFARFWLHNGMLDFGGAKMSKSLGNVSVLHELIAKYPPEALRFALLTAQYRQPLDWSDTLIEQSIKTLDRLYGTLRDLAGIAAVGTGIPESIDDALCDDLNTPAALAEIARIAGEARRATDEGEKAKLKADLIGAGLALGLLQQDPVAWFQRPVHATANIELGALTLSAAGKVTVGLSNEQIDDLMAERDSARKAKDFARSDAIRDKLAAEGIVLEDTASGARWVRKRS